MNPALVYDIIMLLVAVTLAALISGIPKVIQWLVKKIKEMKAKRVEKREKEGFL